MHRELSKRVAEKIKQTIDQRQKEKIMSERFEAFGTYLLDHETQLAYGFGHEHEEFVRDTVLPNFRSGKSKAEDGYMAESETVYDVLVTLRDTARELEIARADNAWLVGQIQSRNKAFNP